MLITRLELMRIVSANPDSPYSKAKALLYNQGADIVTQVTMPIPQMTYCCQMNEGFVRVLGQVNGILVALYDENTTERSFHIDFAFPIHTPGLFFLQRRVRVVALEANEGIPVYAQAEYRQEIIAQLKLVAELNPSNHKPKRHLSLVTSNKE